MEQRLKEAAQAGNINKLYELIREDPCLLEPIDQKPFADTPLHIAAEAGHTHFALEIMRLKPSFARKLNPSGFSPMHLALQNGKTQTVTRLVNVDPELVRVKGREGVTSLHYITEEGDHNLLAEFITVCPKSVEDLTIRNETALHIAVKNYLPTALEVLLGGLHQLSISEGSQDLKRKVLDLKDEDGKTVLHIAKSNNQPQVVKMLVRNGAAVQVSGTSSVTRAESLRSELSFYKRKIKPHFRRERHIEKINAVMVVAVLIATATYQAGLSPPGGVWQEDCDPPIGSTTNPTTNISPSGALSPPHRVGTTVLAPPRFIQFTSFNSTAFYISIAIILALIPGGIYGSMLQTLLIVLAACHALSVWITSGWPSFTVVLNLSAIGLMAVAVTVLHGLKMVRDNVIPWCWTRMRQ